MVAERSVQLPTGSAMSTSASASARALDMAPINPLKIAAEATAGNFRNLDVVAGKKCGVDKFGGLIIGDQPDTQAPAS